MHTAGRDLRATQRAGRSSFINHASKGGYRQSQQRDRKVLRETGHEQREPHPESVAFCRLGAGLTDWECRAGVADWDPGEVERGGRGPEQ